MGNKFKKIILILLIATGFLFADEWINGKNLNVPRAGAAALSWNGKIYVFGGKSLNNIVLNSVEVYDPNTNNWDTTAIEPFEKERYNAAVTVYNNKFYLIGGRNIDHVLKSVEVYDPVQNKWQEAHDLRNEREGHVSTVFNGRIYSIGGQKGNFDLLESIEWYNADDDEWEDAVFELSYPRSAHFSTVYNDNFFMFGGYYYGLSALSFKAVPFTEGYQWEVLPNLSEARAYGATARIDSLIYIIGGETTDGKTNLVEIFNINSGVLKKGINMNMSHSGMASAVLDNKIFSIGGYEGPENDPVNHVHVLHTTVTAIEKPSVKPQSFLLAKAYPNPFNGNVSIEINLPSNGHVKINIFNALGQKVRNIYDNFLPFGKHTFRWDTFDNHGYSSVSGIYFVQIRFETQYRLLKLIYVK